MFNFKYISDGYTHSCWRLGGLKGSSPLTSSPSALRVHSYFLISLTSILIDVSACQPSAAAARAPVEEESIFLLENPEDLPSNEMLSRSSESSCQKKAARRRKSLATCTKHEADSNPNSSYAHYIQRSAQADNWEMQPLTYYLLSTRYLIYSGL